MPHAYLCADGAGCLYPICVSSHTLRSSLCAMAKCSQTALLMLYGRDELSFHPYPALTLPLPYFSSRSRQCSRDRRRLDCCLASHAGQRAWQQGGAENARSIGHAPPCEASSSTCPCLCQRVHSYSYISPIPVSVCALIVSLVFTLFGTISPNMPDFANSCHILRTTSPHYTSTVTSLSTLTSLLHCCCAEPPP